LAGGKPDAHLDFLGHRLGARVLSAVQAWFGRRELENFQVDPKMRMTLAGLAGTCLLATAPQAQESRIRNGLKFAQANCASCHAIGTTGESPLPAAPLFRTLHLRYPVEDLAEAFAEGIMTAHPGMPQFQLDVAQIEDLIAYLKSLER
jgi:cytochrome c